MDILYQLAIVVVPLIPIFFLSRLLILMCREFVSPVASILIGNAIAFAVMLVLGAIALSTAESLNWWRSISLFSIYGVVVLFDLARAALHRLEQNDAALLPPLPRLNRQAPAARDRHKLRP